MHIAIKNWIKNKENQVDSKGLKVGKDGLIWLGLEDWEAVVQLSPKTHSYHTMEEGLKDSCSISTGHCSAVSAFLPSAHWDATSGRVNFNYLNNEAIQWSHTASNLNVGSSRLGLMTHNLLFSWSFYEYLPHVHYLMLSRELLQYLILSYSNMGRSLREKIRVPRNLTFRGHTGQNFMWPPLSTRKVARKLGRRLAWWAEIRKWWP